MKILVTGAAGFVGHYLTTSLAGGSLHVIATDITPGENIHACDITDFSAVKKLVTDTTPDIIFHLAAVSHVRGSEPRTMHEINLSGTINLLEAASALESSPHFIFASSSQVYGAVKKDKLPLAETSLPAPVNHYGASKAAAEQMVSGYAHENHFPATILRPFNHTGPGQALNFLVPKLVDAFARRKPSITLGNLNVSRDISDVRDIIRAYTDVIDKTDRRSAGTVETCNICSEKPIALQEIFDRLVEITGHRPAVESAANLQRRNDMDIVYGSAEKFKNEFNWKPRHDIIETLKWMLNES